MLYAAVSLAALPLILVLLVFILHWAADLLMYPRAVAAFRALGLPADVQASAVACFDRARAIDRSVRPCDALAPIAVAIALLFTPRSANALPAWASRWDNNVSLNGDSAGWQRADGTWVQVRDEWNSSATLVSYDDPAYGGDAYYCRGHHPRSWLARWVWVGWRNRCSQLSADRGVTVRRADVRNLVGEQNLSTSQMGAFVAQCGDAFHYKEHSKLGPFVLIRSLGFKLGAPDASDTATRQAAAVCIPIALKRLKGAA